MPRAPTSISTPTSARELGARRSTRTRRRIFSEATGRLSADADRHLDEQEALDWLEGRLPADRLGPALTHVGQCDGCRHLVAAIARAIDEGPGADARPTVEPGDVIGAYRVSGTLGAGAMGVVFRGTDARLQREVALKVVHDPRLTAARVREEARALARLNHPHVVTVLAAGDSAYGPWIAMELVEGWTLAEWARRKRPSIQERERALVDAARGLLAAHAAGIVHGDFKPANVLVGRDGRVQVADFGLARAEPAARSRAPIRTASTLTSTAIGGTPAYLAPEVLGGARPSRQSDQFSFCVTAWELLGGSRPFSAHDATALRTVMLDGPPAPPPSISRRWRDELRRGLAPRPEDRHTDLEAFLARVVQPRVAGRSSRLPGALLGVGTLGLVAALAWPRGEPCASLEPVVKPGALAPAALPDVGSEDRERLRRWASDWRAEREAACRAEDVRRADCLDLLQARFDGRLEGLHDGVRPASGVLYDIDDPVSCATPGEMPREAAPPEIRALRRRYAAARGRWGSVAPTEEASTTFAALVAEAKSLGDARTEVGARLSLARVEHLLDRFESAEEHYERAYFDALAHEDPKSAWDGALGMAQTVGHGQARFSDALGWIKHARAQLEFLPDAERASETDKVHGELLITLQRYDEAEVVLERSLAVLPEDAPLRDRATVLETIGNALAAQWKGEEAVPYFREAMALHEQRGPSAHKDIPRALNGLAVSLTQLERYDEAIDVYERAAVFIAEEGPSMKLAGANLETNLGVLYDLQEQYEAALERYLRGCAILWEELGAGPEVFACQLNLARTYANLDRHEDAVVAARSCVDVAEKVDPPAYQSVARCLGITARSLDHLQRFEAAASTWRRRIAVRRDLDEVDPVERLEDELALARSLLGASDRQEATAVVARVRDAVDARAETPSELAEELEALEAELSAGDGSVPTAR